MDGPLLKATPTGSGALKERGTRRVTSLPQRQHGSSSKHLYRHCAQVGESLHYLKSS